MSGKALLLIYILVVFFGPLVVFKRFRQFTLPFMKNLITIRFFIGWLAGLATYWSFFEVLPVVLQ